MRVEFSRKAAAKLLESGESLSETGEKILSEMKREMGDHFASFVLYAYFEGEDAYVCLPSDDEDEVVLVYPGSFEEIDVGGEGNFAPGGVFEGKKLLMPVPEYDDERLC